MDAKIDPKVVMDLSVFKSGRWNILQPSNRKLSEEFIHENEPRLSIRIPSRGSFFTIQYLERPLVCDNRNVKESEPLCEALDVLVHSHRRLGCTSETVVVEGFYEDGKFKDAIRIE